MEVIIRTMNRSSVACPPVAEPLLAFRVPPEILKRIERLLAAMENDPELRGLKHNKGSVARAALLRGLEELEQKYGAPTPARTTKRRK